MEERLSTSAGGGGGKGIMIHRLKISQVTGELSASVTDDLLTHLSWIDVNLFYNRTAF